MKRILLIGALPRSLINFRESLLKAMLTDGYKVFVAANGNDPNTEARLQDMGVEYYSIRIARAGMNPLVDLITLFDLIKMIRRVNPDVVLNYTIKPIIFGGLAAKFCRVGAIYSLLTGLGYAFVDTTSPRQRLAGWFAKFLYSLSLRYSQRVFFQNPNDEQLFVTMGLIPQNKTVVLNGSGIDLTSFPYVPFNQKSFALPVPLRFLLIARLLKDKGIKEYVEAAKIIKKSHFQTEFHLVGSFDPNPSGLKTTEIRAWEDADLIKFHGEQSDVRPFLRDCHIYVLPSFYREGTPRTVLEAMATGRAIITTDAPGCRETVDKPASKLIWKTEENINKLKIGRNGILVPIKDVESLVVAMEFFLKNPEQITIMGRESRSYAEERYNVHKVNTLILREMGLEKGFHNE